ncbi:MAG: winged helix-turn-helix transcriptional regulator [Flavobacteriales bacterium]|nr:winged helix-turn-helix transcriptional regulator [Flavobacteriales bacterium]
MGASKSAYFNEQQNSMAALIKAMAHPARIAIVEHLIKVESCICNDIVDEIPLSQPTVSQHLKELKMAGIIKGNIEGNSICYCLDQSAIDKLRDYFNGISVNILHPKTNCC